MGLFDELKVMYQNQKFWFFSSLVFFICSVCFTALLYYYLIRLIPVAQNLHISALWLVVSGAFIAFVYVFTVVVYFFWGWDQDPGDVPETIKQPPTPDRTLAEINFFFESPADLGLNAKAVIANILRLMFKGKVRVEYDEHNVYFYINDAVQLDLRDEEKHTLEFIKCFRYDDQKGAYYVRYNPLYSTNNNNHLAGFDKKKRGYVSSVVKKLKSIPNSKEYKLLSSLASDAIMLFSSLLLFSWMCLLPAPEHVIMLTNYAIVNDLITVVVIPIASITRLAVIVGLFAFLFFYKSLVNLIRTVLYDEDLFEKMSAVFLLLLVMGSTVIFWYSWFPSGIYTQVSLGNVRGALLPDLFFLSCMLGVLGGSGLYVKWKGKHYRELLEWQAFKRYISEIDDPRVFMNMDEKEFHRLLVYVVAVDGQRPLYSLYPASTGAVPVRTKFQKLLRTLYVIDRALSQDGVSYVFR